VLKRVSGTKRKVYGNSGNYVLRGFIICVILPVLRMVTMDYEIGTMCNTMEGSFNRTSLST
jgi:hypothetical protein